MKNLDKLRPLDVEKMKAGEPIFHENGEYRKYLYGPDTANKIAIVDDKGLIQRSLRWEENYRMAPLFWLEGDPVYKGDVLYRKDIEITATADHVEIEGSKSYIYFKEGGNARLHDGGATLSWHKPKVKREGWINVYPNGIVYGTHKTKQIADDSADSERLACIRIEWEE